jgi:hypothetical protein
MAERADTLRNRVDSERQLRAVLPLQPIRCRVLNIGPFHVPVEVMGLQIERVGVGQQFAEAVRDRFAILL